MNKFNQVENQTNMAFLPGCFEFCLEETLFGEACEESLLFALLFFCGVWLSSLHESESTLMQLCCSASCRIFCCSTNRRLCRREPCSGVEDSASTIRSSSGCPLAALESGFLSGLWVLDLPFDVFLSVMWVWGRFFLDLLLFCCLAFWSNSCALDLEALAFCKLLQDQDWTKYTCNYQQKGEN